jgi:hypothetical protein
MCRSISYYKIINFSVTINNENVIVVQLLDTLINYNSCKFHIYITNIVQVIMFCMLQIIKIF